MEISQPTTLEPPVKKSLDPLFALWTQPRATIRRLVDRPEHQLILMAAMVGIYSAINTAHVNDLGDRGDPLLVLGLTLVLGTTVLGVLLLYLTARVIEWTGGFLGGTASGKEIRTAVAWANVPHLIGLVIYAIQLPIYGEELFLSSTPRIDADPWLQVGLVGFGLLRWVLSGWGLVILVRTLAEVQGFSVWRSIGNIVISVLVLFAFGMLLALPVILFLR